MIALISLVTLFSATLFSVTIYKLISLLFSLFLLLFQYIHPLFHLPILYLLPTTHQNMNSLHFYHKCNIHLYNSRMLKVLHFTHELNFWIMFYNFVKPIVSFHLFPSFYLKFLLRVLCFLQSLYQLKIFHISLFSHLSLISYSFHIPLIVFDVAPILLQLIVVVATYHHNIYEPSH